MWSGAAHASNMANTFSRISRWQLGFVILFVVALIGVSVWQYRPSEATVVLGGQELNVLVAKTRQQQYRGLGRRASLGEADGMLFPFGLPSRIGIVMRDMEFPIDIIWLRDGTIVDIAPSVPTEPGVSETNLRVYYPRVEANAVLEVPAGWVAAHGVKIGDTLERIEG